MNADEREHWVRQMLERSSKGEPLIRPAYCSLLSIYSPTALIRLVNRGDIPTIKIGKRVYVVTSVIADWIVAETMKRHHSVMIHRPPEATNTDPSRGHPMDDLPDDDTNQAE